MFEVVEVAEAARKAAGAEVALVSDGELCDAVRLLAQARSALEAAEAHVLAELDARGVCDREFGHPTLWWVTAQTRAARSSVAARLALGRKLRELEVVDEALTAGTITADHARAVATVAANPRIVDELAVLQDEIVDFARQHNFAVWRQHLSALERLLDQDGGYDPDRDLARNQLRVSSNGSDGIWFKGELVGEHALSFKTLLDAETDRRYRALQRDHDACGDLPIPSRATLQALALTELVRAGAAADRAATTGPVVDITVIRHAGEAVTAHHAHLHCDPVLTPITIDDTGVPLHVGRTSRYATPTQRRALAIRDGGCVFPDCDTPVSWCDAHHVTPWEHGGTTDLPNLALLCRRHHGVTHRHGWTMTAHPDQTFTWTTPTGHTLTSQRQRGSPTLAT